jgi:hypothetical protein
VVARHEALRARVVVEGGRAAQRIDPPGPVTLAVVDLQGLAAAGRRDQVLASLVRLLDGRFDPGGPLWRANLVRLGPREHVLAMAVDELVCDARSRVNLIREVVELHAARVEGRQPRLPELTLGYGDHIEGRRRWLATPDAARATAAWRAAMADVDAPPLDGDRPPGDVPAFGGERLGHPVPADVLHELKALTERLGVSRYQCMAAVFSALLSAWTGRRDFVMATHVLNRQARGSEHLVGNFMNTMLPRCRWSGDPSFAELLTLARTATLTAHSWTELPASRVLGAAGWGRGALRSFGCQFQLAVHHDRRDNLALPAAGGATARFEYVYLGRFSGELGLFAYELEDELEVMIEYSTDRFDEPTILRFRDHLGTLLERAVAAPDRPLSALLAGMGSPVGGWRS